MSDYDDFADNATQKAHKDVFTYVPCVDHGSGWCALEGRASDPQVKTLCGKVIDWPLAFAKYEPTCRDCRRKMRYND